jgi:hypothetical protein
MRKIPVYATAGQTEPFAFALVDDDDFERLNHHRWTIDARARYAHRGVWRNGTSRKLLMHREVMGLQAGDSRQVDHIHGNLLDNRKAELRILPGITEQCQNLRPKPGGSSGFRGVTWHRGVGKWQAQVRVGGKDHYLGLFGDVLDAARAASRFRSLHMPYAVEEGLPS